MRESVPVELLVPLLLVALTTTAHAETPAELAKQYSGKAIDGYAAVMAEWRPQRS